MNNIRSDLPKKDKDFFYKLSDYLDTDLYFYGSVTRSDYIHKKSDIDVAIFTDNEYSMISKLQHFLHVKRDAFEKVVWKLHEKVLYGYKIKCGKYIDINCEIAIYNNEYKEPIINDMNKCNIMPFYIQLPLFFLKLIHYTIPILPYKIYNYYKRVLFNDILLNKKNQVFLVLKQDQKQKVNQ